MRVKVCGLGLPICFWAMYYNPQTSVHPSGPVLSFPQVPLMEKETIGSHQGTCSSVAMVHVVPSPLVASYKVSKYPVHALLFKWTLALGHGYLPTELVARETK